MSRDLTDIEWARLACSVDSARPVLTGLYVEEARIVATDGHRLHLVEDSCGLAPGLTGKDCRPIPGDFPKWEQVVPLDPPTLAVEDLLGMRAITAAVIAAEKVSKRNDYVTLPSKDGSFVAVNPIYFLDLLKMAGKGVKMVISITTPTSPVRMETLAEIKRVGVLMPIRRHGEEAGPHPRFDLSEFVKVAA